MGSDGLARLEWREQDLYGRNPFEGHKTQRVYTLVARGRLFEDLVEHPRILAICDQFLLPNYLLTANQAICIHPGEQPQDLHTDDSFYTIPRPRPAVSVSTIWSVDAFTAENGGTEIIPRSHVWGDGELESVNGGVPHGMPVDPKHARALVPVEMPPGSCVVFLGTLVHRGGANRSTAPRLAFSNQYCQPWARPQENFLQGVPLGRARTMSPRVRALLGYSVYPPFMGHLNGMHPERILDPAYESVIERADALAGIARGPEAAAG